MIKIGIVGYGNLGRGVEETLKENSDMELIGIFTRRDPKSIKTNSPIFKYELLNNFIDKIDVLILCGGSYKDLPIQSIETIKNFNIVDSFDNHKNIETYIKNIDNIAKETKHTGISSIGWDPGIFSMMRVLFTTILKTNAYTFWGEGVSQGHSDAIRKIDGVKDAVQYTIPYKNAIESVRNGNGESLTTKDKHYRECYVVIKDGYDKEKIEEEIKTMPNYFDEYNTIVHFISEEELKKHKSKMPHGGFVIANDDKSKLEFSLKLESNPYFTASILVSYARACYKLNNEKKYGSFNILDIPLSYISNLTYEELIKKI